MPGPCFLYNKSESVSEAKGSVFLKFPQVNLMNQFAYPVCYFSGYQLKETGGPGGLC